VDYQHSSMVTIRARVLPKGEEKKPFLIQKQFDIDGLRASIPAPPRFNCESGIDNSVRLRRSSRVWRSSAQHSMINSKRKGSSENQGGKARTLGKGAMPIRECVKYDRVFKY
jgi:hypothetical protein